MKKHLKSKSRSYQSKFQKQEEIKSKKRDGITFFIQNLQTKRGAARFSAPPPFLCRDFGTLKSGYRCFSCFLFLLVFGLCFDNFLICFSGVFSIYSLLFNIISNLLLIESFREKTEIVFFCMKMNPNHKILVSGVPRRTWQGPFLENKVFF